MRSLPAAFAATILATALGAGAARAADPAEGYYEERDVAPPPLVEHRVERRVEQRVYIEEPSWRRVEIEEPLVEERVVVRRRVIEDGPPRWRRVHVHEDRRWDGPRFGGPARPRDDDEGLRGEW